MSFWAAAWFCALNSMANSASPVKKSSRTSGASHITGCECSKLDNILRNTRVFWQNGRSSQGSGWSAPGAKLLFPAAFVAVIDSPDCQACQLACDIISEEGNRWHRASHLNSSQIT
ncbi:hypothetical protein V8C86DRAFT_2717308, partial [Haematococcus lacustris]